jgi:Holliday junction resolvasome RuvABC DNA-binding subunit
MAGGIQGDNALISDAISALIALGYSPREARQVILKVDLESATSVEAIIKQALKELA